MSRSVAALIGITLGLPILAMIAITAASGVKSDILMILLAGGVVTAFLVAAIFEIKRLSDLDSHRGVQPDVIPDGTPATPQVQEVTLPPLTMAASAVEDGAGNRMPRVPLQAEVIPDGTPATLQVQEMALPPLTIASAVDDGPGNRMPGVRLDSLEKLGGTAAEPIVVEPVAETVAAPRAKTRPKAGPRKPRSAAVTDALTSNTAPAVPKTKRKGGQRKPANSV